MNNFYKRLNSGWSRLLHLILSLGFGVLGMFLTAVVQRYPRAVPPITGLILGIVVYQFVAPVALWVVDGFKSDRKAKEEQVDELQIATSTQETETRRGKSTATKQVFVKWILPVLLFFLFYLLLYCVVVFSSSKRFTESLIPVCVLVSIVLSRYLGKYMKAVLLK